jgi:hypothetical protein
MVKVGEGGVGMAGNLLVTKMEISFRRENIGLEIMNCLRNLEE